jgi:hypothetical protein
MFFKNLVANLTLVELQLLANLYGFKKIYFFSELGPSSKRIFPRPLVRYFNRSRHRQLSFGLQNGRSASEFGSHSSGHNSDIHSSCRPSLRPRSQGLEQAALLVQPDSSRMPELRSRDEKPRIYSSDFGAFGACWRHPFHDLVKHFLVD